MKLTRPCYSKIPALAALACLLTLSVTQRLNAADITWNNGLGSAYEQAYFNVAGNWAGGVVPGPADNAIIGDTTSLCTNAYYDFSGDGTITIGSLTDSSAHAASQGNQIFFQSGVSQDTLILMGDNGYLINNLASTGAKDQFQFGQSSTHSMLFELGGSGYINEGAVSATNLFYIGISDSGVSTGYGFTNIGLGTLCLDATSNCAYSGVTSLNSGTIKLANAGCVLGTNTVYLAGGNLLASADHSANPITSPIVVQGNSTVYGNGGTALTTGNGGATTPTALPFTGPFSGSSGSLSIANLGKTGTVFNMIMSNSGFNFTLPITVGATTGSVVDTSGAHSVFLFYNSTGSQIFSGIVSGEGGVQRGAGPGLTGGTTIFTGNNTYTGGTTITNGTLLANNTAGSALGSGPVVVTNGGVLGGTGFIVAATAVTKGGLLLPGSSGVVGNLSISALTLDQNAVYDCQIAATGGTAGVNCSMLTVGNWVETANVSSTTPIHIKLDSMGATPTGWSSSTSYDWIIIQGGTYGGSFNAANYALDTSAFSGAVAGTFSLNVDGSGNLHVTYTATVVTPPAPTLSGTITGAGTSSATLSWSSASGVLYDVYYTTNLAPANWLLLGTYPATGTTTSCVDATGPWPQCFYRINAHH